MLAVVSLLAFARTSSSRPLRDSPTPAAHKLAELVLSLVEGLKQGPQDKRTSNPKAGQ